MQKTQKNWTSLDIHLSAYLAYRGIPIELENLKRRVVFSAPQSEELYRLKSAYYANVPVPIGDYVDTLKALETHVSAIGGAK